MAVRQCTNVACSFRGIEIKTDQATCLGCGRDLGATVRSTLDDIVADHERKKGERQSDFLDILADELKKKGR